MNVFERQNSLLGLEFDRYVREHPSFAEKIPNNAHVILLLEGDKAFNEWSVRVGRQQAEKGQPLIYVIIKKLSPARSRIKELKLTSGLNKRWIA